MSSTSACPRCGASLSARADSRGLCARCLMNVALEEAREAPWDGRGDAPGPRGVATRPLEREEVEALLPQFEVHDLLGQGGMGTVFKARHREKRRWVALKILHVRVSAEHAGVERAFAERFGREARALESLHHSNIVALHESGEADGRLYLAMEYVDGRTLRDLLRTGQLAPTTAFSIVAQLCDALEAAHAQGFVHRDLKPENVIVNALGTAKLADFGLAKLRAIDGARENLTGEQETMGTPHYMAPEQIEKPRSVDHRADLFALGVLFYELLTGELPLGRFQPPSQLVPIDPRIDGLILRALEKNPARRPQSAAQFRADLEHVLHTPAPIRGAEERLRRLRLDQTSPHRPWSLVRAFVVLFPLAMLIGLLGDALNSSLLILSLWSLGLFLWGERLVGGRDRLAPAARLWLLIGALAVLAALFVFAPAVARWAYGLFPDAEIEPRHALAIRCIAAVSLAHLLWAAWKSWDSFRPRPTRSGDPND